MVRNMALGDGIQKGTDRGSAGGCFIARATHLIGLSIAIHHAISIDIVDGIVTLL